MTSTVLNLHTTFFDKMSVTSAGIDAAEDELGELWRLRQGLAEDQACLRLHQVLETYTDVTRFQP